MWAEQEMLTKNHVDTQSDEEEDAVREKGKRRGCQCQGTQRELSERRRRRNRVRNDENVRKQ